jgi:hypothetical protein
MGVGLRHVAAQLPRHSLRAVRSVLEGLRQRKPDAKVCNLVKNIWFEHEPTWFRTENI